jgi:hypothetical protein
MMSKEGILNAVDQLLEKAKGYTQHKGSGKEAEAVDHSIPTVEPGADEKKKERNEANSGTHPESGGPAGKKARAEGGADFKDGGPEEDTIETPKSSGGRAPVARPDSIKHEGGGVGPNHPGTATTTQKQQKSEDPDLTKSEDEEAPEKAEGEENKEEDDDDDSEKSSDSDEIWLDIDKFAEELVAKAVERLEEKFTAHFEEAVRKSEESEYIEAALAKSVASTLDRVEMLEKSIGEVSTAVVNVANAMTNRKSLVKSSDNIKGIANPSLSKNQLSKSEISSRLLEMQMSGVAGIDSQTILKFDAVGDPSILSESIREKLGIE